MDISKKPDIDTVADVELLVNQFYAAIRSDERLGPIFEAVIQDRWPAHLEKMVRFWQTILLKQPTYIGSPFPPHAKLPVTKADFDHWADIFVRVVDTHFSGQTAEDAKTRALQMAALFQMKHAHFRDRPHRSLM